MIFWQQMRNQRWLRLLGPERFLVAVSGSACRSRDLKAPATSVFLEIRVMKPFSVIVGYAAIRVSRLSIETHWSMLPIRTVCKRSTPLSVRIFRALAMIAAASVRPLDLLGLVSPPRSGGKREAARAVG